MSTTPTDPAAAAHLSLAEVHSSVGTTQLGLWQRMFAFAGPAYLVSVGYMDPGNWATDLEGGARFGYRLLWVLVMSNLMAILLQTLSARLGIVGGRDLAQACRETYPRPVTHALWVLCEIAIAACDLAEVLGAAISLNLLFHLPLLWGVILTAADTLLVLWFQRFGIRIIEAFVLALITIIAGCFCVEIFLAKPAWSQMATGLIPRLNSGNLYIVIGIIGATVMPHNLYLHSALVQTRRIGLSDAAKRIACRYNLIDSVVALNGALLVNAAILIVAGTVFFSRGIVVTEIQQAHLLLAPLLGTTVAGAVFAIALLASGQSSTLTGTLAGQIVMEGFLNFRMRPWLRRLMTRSLAVIPAAITIYFTGNSGTFRLLILSQVIINMQLPFAVIPLLHFTGDRRRMGEFANKLWVSILSWIVAAIIVVLNAWLIWQSISDWLNASGVYRPYVLFLVVIVVSFIAALLIWVTAEPLFARWGIHFGLAPITLPPTAVTATEAPVYRRILVPLDHTALDHVAIAHAAAMARMHHAKLYLLHVEEDVTSQIYGSLSSTAEVQAGRRYLDDIVASLRAEGVEVETMVAHSPKPTREIIRCASLIQPDLLVMGAHGHGGLKDLIFGATINSVRHKLRIPLLVVRSS
jgi:manganese transport protein